MPWRFEFGGSRKWRPRASSRRLWAAEAASAAALRSRPGRSCRSPCSRRRPGSTTAPTPVAHCPYFNNRAPKPDWGLTNCTWHRPMSCCGVSEEARLVATFEEHLVTGELLGCQQQLNYLLCWPCDAGQQYYYDLEHNELSVCRSFCDDLYGACKSAGFKGATLEPTPRTAQNSKSSGQGRLGRGQLSEGVRRRLHRARLAVPPRTGPWRAGERGDGPTARRGRAGWGLLGIVGLAFALDGSRRPTRKTRKRTGKVPVLLATLAPARGGDARRDGAALGRERRRGVAKRVARRAAAGRAPDLADEASTEHQHRAAGFRRMPVPRAPRRASPGSSRSSQAYAYRDGAPVGRPATLQGHRHAETAVLLRRRPGPAPGHRVLGAVQAKGLRHALVRQGAGPGNAGPEHQADHRLDAGPGAAGLAHAALREEPVRLALLCLRRAGRGHPAAPRLGAAAEPRAVPAGLRPAAAPMEPGADLGPEGRGHRHRHVILDGRMAQHAPRQARSMPSSRRHGRGLRRGHRGQKRLPKLLGRLCSLECASSAACRTSCSRPRRPRESI